MLILIADQGIITAHQLQQPGAAGLTSLKTSLDARISEGPVNLGVDCHLSCFGSKVISVYKRGSQVISHY